jgi:hypothetical protein
MTDRVAPVDPGELREGELKLEFVHFGLNKIHKVPTSNVPLVTRVLPSWG